MNFFELRSKIRCYSEVLTRLRVTVRRKRHELWLDKRILYRDNTPVHDELKVFKFLA
jgi:hypothetical protein